jgi:pyruvate formate lyase activating enzyme
VLCGEQSEVVSSFLGVCRSCIINRPERALEITGERHAQSRIRFALHYPEPSQGVKCGLCGNNCRIGEGEVGFCGLQKNEKGMLHRPKGLVAEAHYDPHPTNCVPMQFCRGSGAGHPTYSYSAGREIGYHNLSVFCIGWSYDCSFCQNWHYREMANRKEDYGISKQELR